MNKLTHRNDNKLKVEFVITLESLEGLASENDGTQFFVELKRGLKPTGHKTSQPALAKDKKVQFKQSLVVTSTFYQNKSTKKLNDKKELAIHVKEVKKDKKEKEKEKEKEKDKKEKEEKEKGSTFADAKINLALFADHGKSVVEKVLLKPKHKMSSTPTLTLKIDTKWIKMNNKKLVQNPDGKGEIQVGGHGFHLDDVSERTESTIPSDDEVEEIHSDEEDDKSKDGRSRTNSHLPVPKKEEKGGETHSPEISAAELDDLKKDKTRLERKVAKLTTELEELRGEMEKKEAEHKQEVEHLKEKQQSTTHVETNAETVGHNDQEVEKLKQHVSGLEAQLQTLKSENESLKKDKSHLEKEKDELKGEKSQLEKSLDSKKEELKKKTAELEAASSQKTQVASQEQATGVALKELQDKNQKLEEKCEKRKEKKKALATQLAKSEAEVATLKGQVDSSQKQILSLQQEAEKVRTLEAELKQTQEAEARSKQALLSKADASQELTSELKRNTEILNKTKEELAKAKEQLGEKETELAAAKDESNKYKEQLAAAQEVKTSLAESKEKSKQLKKQNEQLEDDLKAEREKVVTLQGQLAKEKELLQKAQSEADTAKQAESKLHSELKEKDQKLQSELQQSKEREQKLEKDLQKSKEREQKLEKDLEKQKEKVEQIQSNSAKDNKDEKIHDLEKSLEKLEKEKETVHSSLDELKEEHETLTKNYSRLQDTHNQTKTEMEALQNQIQELKQHQDSAKKVQENEEEQLKKLQQARQSKESETLKKKLKSLEKENRELKALETIIYGAEISYEQDKPVAVGELLKVLHSWESFEPLDVELLDLIVTSIRKAFPRNANDNAMLCYWLAFVRTLFQSLIKELPASAQVDKALLEKDDVLSLDKSSLENKSPATKFLYELIFLSYDIYQLLLFNIFGQLEGTMIPLLQKTDIILSSPKDTKKKNRSSHEFANIVNDIFGELRKNHVPEHLQAQIIKQVLYFADVQAFNLLLDQPAQTCGSGFQLKMSLNQFESTFSKTEKKLQNWVSENFFHIREYANLLVLEKSIVLDKSAKSEVFPHLNSKQIKHLLERFKPDELSPNPVDPKILQTLDTDLKSSPGLGLQLDPVQIDKTNLLKDLIN